MDINLRLLSERLRRLLAGEEGLLPDAAKAQIQNLYSEIGIVLSWLRDYEYEEVSYLLKKISGNIDFTVLEPLEKEINYFAYESEKVADTLVMGIVLQESESGSKEIIHDALLPLQSKIIDIKQRMQQVQQMPNEIFDAIKLILDDAGNSPASSRFKKRDIVGLDDKMEELLDLLIEGPPQLSVIAILDSIGFDKTAFAAEAYDSNYVKYYFDCHAWVSASFFNDSDHLLDNLMEFLIPSSRLSEIMDKSSEMKKTILGDFLKNKRYLIVLDDVWVNYIWDDIQELLPDNHNGSRVLVTLTHIDNLTSFQLENGDYIQLDLVPTGGLLRVTYNGWPFLILYHGSISLQENVEETVIKPLSGQIFKYLTLPFHLKICCLYICVFPIHFEISTMQLYQLWIAEGFIGDNNEATAEYYLEQLISRDLVEAKKRRVGGTIKTCSLPSRWWSVLMLVANFAEFIYFPSVPLEYGFGGNIKRFATNIVIYTKRGLDLLEDLDSCLHSLLYLFPKRDNLHHSKCQKICKNFKFLRVLNLESPVLDQYPSEIDNLFLLKYLKLNIPSLKNLPSSLLCNLLNLYTLDMSSSYIDHMPDDIWKMIKLRHLIFGLIVLPPHPGKYCSSLENLNFISALHPKSCSLDILGRLPNLRNLRIWGDLGYYQSSLSNSLCRLSCLESLKLVNDKMPRLSKIVLLEYEFPPSLTRLSLSYTELMEDPMSTLEKLPLLQVLKLKQNSYAGRKLACGPYGFPKLKVLHLKSMLWLVEWTMGIGAMPKLECLMINPCAYLKSLPEQLWCKKSFKKLELWWPQVELRQKLRDFEDKEQYDIQIYPLGM